MTTMMPTFLTHSTECWYSY